MDIRTALSLEIGQLHQPVVTSYQLGLLVFKLYQTGVYRGEKLGRIHKPVPDRADYRRLIMSLMQRGVLQNSKNVPHREIFTVLGRDGSPAEDVACCADPFGYVSHLSAMEFHGLTDRLPKMLFLTTLPSAQWGQQAAQRMKKDLGEDHLTAYLEATLPTLRRFRLAKIYQKTLNIHATTQCDPGAYLAVQGRTLRVSTIGRTFLDMLREPDLCGGIYHVLEAFSGHAGRYLRLIVDTIDRHGSKIDKIRAGYILEERLGLSHPTIDVWHALVQRGGSQKLYAQAPYNSIFSERWCLSINVEEAEEEV